MLVAPALVIDGPYFSGIGTAMGKTIMIEGRLDAAKASRLMAQYHSTTGQVGRIVATLPADSGNDSWEK